MQDAPVHAVPEAGSGPPQSAPPRWSFARCLGFRFACVYLVLYSFPWPIGWIPGTERLVEPYDKLWESFLPWLGKTVFHLADVPVANTGSGDTTFSYLMLACMIVLSVALTALWTVLVRPKQHEVLGHWLRVYVRYVLASAMLGYGMLKVFKSQFPEPSALRLLQPYGDSSPMALLWTFMGFSTPYTFFVGSAEVLGGLLLLFRRTTMLGGLVVLAVMSNVVMLNFCYDVPVKLYSVHLWLMAAFLLLPDVPRLFDFFLRNRPTQPATLTPHGSRAAARLRLAGKVALVGYLLFSTSKVAYEGWREYGDGRTRDALDGAYDVVELKINQAPVPETASPSQRWRRVGISTRGRLTIRHMDDSMQRYRLEKDSKGNAFTVWPDTSKVKTTLAYSWADSAHLDLHGALEGDSVSARLQKIPTTQFALLSRGFHWVSEVPYNK
ncbi:MAG TPA: hypothetical protein VFX78_04965 [Candidatus Eisenbacteria bacterium]|jgi:hypothetical protein|nr:hypothetical protein [Candidatus Eisenbacteria bacterium]